MLSALACLALIAVEPTASAAPPKPASSAAVPPADVETAEQLYAKLDYEQANAVADRVIKKAGLTHDQLVRAYRILAVTDAILDKEEQARDAFLQLLTFDPEYRVDTNLGPKVNTPFMEARGSFRSLASKPGVDVSATVATSGGTLKITTHNPTRIAKKLVVGYRWTSSGDYTVSQLAVGDAAVVEVGPAPKGRSRLDFYAQALDEHDNAVFEAGNPLVPKSAFAEAGTEASAGSHGETKKSEQGGSFLSSPLFWGITGAAVLVGGGTALFLALRPQDPPTSASLSPVLMCGGARCN
ncbi:hypothetical protein AKJ09_10138 [Labilithrix luteola]|uniref:Tetratricopeptide repeat protein n=2 Tax=Labilithrix luteola TaxID=1391654 RepID=A0A0K1QDG5_9BACT|nr:hypothetical protein AKJ09_10138 [Labilithrix luteola]